MRAMRAGQLRCRLTTALLTENGQAMTEYALVLSLIAMAAAALLAATGIGQTIVDQIGNQLGKIGGFFPAGGGWTPRPTNQNHKARGRGCRTCGS
jgi:Flp pilus assembly pilin Flp